MPEGLDLSPRNAEIIRLYNEGDTLRSISDHFELSRERVRQVLEGAGIETRRPGRPTSLRYKPGFGKLTAKERFMKYILKRKGHWVYKGASKEGTSHNYPVFIMRGKRMFAHQAAFFFTKGRMPNGRMRRQCGVFRCVNPEHWKEKGGNNQT
jgi:hypothetical protein